jgi:hypothetical protein
LRAKKIEARMEQAVLSMVELSTAAMVTAVRKKAVPQCYWRLE